MKIQSANVIATCPGRNFITLKITTDQGVYGIGDATLNGRELAVASYLEDHVIPCLIGMDPRRIENLEAFRLVRHHTTTPLAVGEIFNTVWDAKDLIQNQLIDYIRCTIVGAGGITHMRRIADLAALYQIRTGSRGATDLSPVTMGCALHFDTWVPNFGIQEYMRHTEETDAVFPHDSHFDAGELFCGETPGHGVDSDEALAAKFPYKPAYLPVARLEDGTIWNW